MSSDPKQQSGPGADGHAPAPTAPRTGEGASTALEALIRKRKQVEGPDLPDCDVPQPANP
ncbi:hypothetical protein WG902_08780 [Ramlibacter sp. PS3R-8]|uniref:hypothetical protein n=1 Tax=Ramlibacter sp. PS3R-8 TaxID=3133437 RepID=UPI0030AED3ED